MTGTRVAPQAHKVIAARRDTRRCEKIMADEMMKKTAGGNSIRRDEILQPKALTRRLRKSGPKEREALGASIKLGHGMRAGHEESWRQENSRKIRDWTATSKECPDSAVNKN